MTLGTALVTGANGFLGRYVADRLIAIGYRVVTLGRGVAKEHIEDQAAFLAPDPTDAAVILAVMEKINPAVILHLAGTTAAHPIADAYRVNTLFAVNLLDAARRQAIMPRVLLVGSAAEYGPVEDADLPITETTRCQPTSVYGITKLAQTLHGLAMARTGLPVTIARLFNVVGGGMPGHLALGSFAQQIQDMPASGGVLRTGRLDRERDFVEVGPAAAVLADLVRDPAASGQAINVCSGQPRSLALFVESLIANAGKTVTQELDPVRGGNSDAVRHWGSADRLAALGYVLAPADPERVASALVAPSTSTNRRPR